MCFAYPARMRRTGADEVVVTFRNLPDCLTSGSNEEEALIEAKDALEEAIVGRMNRNGARKTKRCRSPFPRRYDGVAAK